MYAADEHYPDEITSGPYPTQQGAQTMAQNPRTATTRSAQTEAQAAKMRLQRRLFAQRLRDTRRAAQMGHPEAVQRLALMRQSQSANMFPNPDRRRDCARHKARAEARYRELEGTDHTASIDAAAQYADLLAVLQLTARY